MRAKLLASTAVGIVLGGILFNSPGAQAVAAVVTDPGSYSIIAAMQSALTTALTKLQDKLYDKFTNIGDLLSDKLSAGFTQQANYTKASIGAQQQMASASNTVMATFQRDVRNAGLRDEHTMSPAACVALNMGQAITVSAGQSWRVEQALAGVSDPRGEGGPGTPAFAGQGQAAAAITQLHRGRYCSQVEATAGLCTVTPARENLDQRATSTPSRSYCGVEPLQLHAGVGVCELPIGLICFLLRLVSQAATSSASVGLSGMRRSRH